MPLTLTSTNTAFIFLCLSLFSLVSASTWEDALALDGSLLGDQPAPTSPPILFNELYPFLSPGSVPVNKISIGSSRRSRNVTRHSQFDSRQQCIDPDYVVVCPVTENLPCCLPSYPVCCHDPSDACCPSGSFCQGLNTCCPTGSTGCGEGCCDIGATCCGAGNPLGPSCCPSGWTCRSGKCVDPALSIASASSYSASLSSVIEQQDHGDADPDTTNTVLVLPSDPRIQYDPPTSWVDTSHESEVGTCTNGTRVARDAGASFTFIFSGSSVSIETAAKAGRVNYTVVIDGKSAGATQDVPAYGQCYIVTSFAQDRLSDSAHYLKVISGGSDAGQLEFSGIIYTGKGAFGTPAGSKKNRAAVVGGAIAGSIAFLFVAILWYYLWMRKRRESGGRPPPMQQQPGSRLGPPSPANQGASSASTGAAWYGQPHSPGYGPTPHSPGYGQAPHSPGYSQVSPTNSVYQPALGVPSGMSEQMPSGTFYGQPSSPPWAQSAIPNPPSTNAASNVDPLPMWVERARYPAASPGQTAESSDIRPDPTPIQGPQPIHDPRRHPHTPGGFYNSAISRKLPFSQIGS